MYPKNAWYVACTPDEIADNPLGRQICGEKMVFTGGMKARSRRWKTSAPIAAPRSPWGMSKTATLCAAITAW